LRYPLPHLFFCADGTHCTHWIQSQSYVTTDGQSASLSWSKAPIWGLRPDLYYCLTVTGFLMSAALSDERTGLPFARFTVRSSKSFVSMYNLSLNSAWSVEWYSLRALRADSLKTPLATALLLLRLVPRHYHPATSYKHLPYCCMTSPAHALYSITSHVHVRTRRKRFNCTVARRKHRTRPAVCCPAMPSANPSQYINVLGAVCGVLAC
jgi:hypothetical protein